MAKLSSSSGGSEDDESAHSFISRQVNTDSSSATLLRTASRTPGVTLVADSGSDRHGIVDLSLLSDPASANVRIEGIVEGADLVATTTGTLKLEVGGRPLVLRDVLHSGQMSDNILSLQRIADKGATIILRQDGGEIVLDQPVATPADAKTVPLERQSSGFWTVTDVSRTAAPAPAARSDRPSPAPRLPRLSPDGAHPSAAGIAGCATRGRRGWERRSGGA
mgnify:FL=1